MTGTTGQDAVLPVVGKPALARPAAELRDGYGLLFARDAGNSFVVRPVRAEDWSADRQGVTDPVWARVTDLRRVPAGRNLDFLDLYCEFMPAGSLAITVLSDALVVADLHGTPRHHS
ncbi:hypothetical protein GCM10010517_11420 [Streptosporangium fragile]|uniref:Uncharacterized protein n=1 Tax=Streptosporangium fragile TaxID=46186 RepID=A0ABN3VSF1_9ACTN